MIEITAMGIPNLKTKVEAGDVFIRQLRQDLREIPEKDATTKYILKHLLDIIALGERLKKYIIGNAGDIVNPFKPSKRQDLSKQIEELFSQASQMNFEQIDISSEQGYTATQNLLKVFEGFQSLFPAHIDENLSRAHKILSEKITAYELLNRVDSKPVEEDVEVYVPSEPASSLDTLSALSQYVDGELKQIAKTPDLNVKIAGYQLLKRFTENACDELKVLDGNKTSLKERVRDAFHSKEKFNQKTADALINKISDAYDATVQELDKKIELIINKHKKLTENFNKRINDSPDDKGKAQLIEKTALLVENLTRVADRLNETKDIYGFETETQLLLDDFSGYLEKEADASKSWFKRYIVEPFEQFKEAMISLIQRMYKKTPEGSTPQQLGLFSDSKKSNKRSFEVYKEGLENLGDDEPPSKKFGG
ncbi:MAG: hypothetical protein P1U36_03630 [Legionellaceae bacterium]|nr:hypothetical protein [Legionellaceae bacterium]